MLTFVPQLRRVAGKKRKDRHFPTTSQKLRTFTESLPKNQAFTRVHAVGIMKLFKIAAQMENQDDK